MKYLMEGAETDRLYFRLLRDSDFDAWLEMFKEQQVAKLLGVENIPSPREQCENWFEKMKFRYCNDLGGMNVLIHKQTNEFIGQSGLLIQEVDGKKELEVAYSILPRFWNMGYATEAACKCCDFAFEHRFSDGLISVIHRDNRISEKVARKVKMEFLKATLFRGYRVNIFGIQRWQWKVVKLNKNGKNITTK